MELTEAEAAIIVQTLREAIAPRPHHTALLSTAALHTAATHRRIATVAATLLPTVPVPMTTLTTTLLTTLRSSTPLLLSHIPPDPLQAELADREGAGPLGQTQWLKKCLKCLTKHPPELPAEKR